MRLTLILASGERRAFDVNAERATIGRRPDCDIPIDDQSVSRIHAEIVRNPDGVYELRDLESLNGVEVRGALVKAHPLAEGDDILIGDARIYVGDAPGDDSTIIIKRPPGGGPPAGHWLDADHRCLRYGPNQIGDRLAPREYALLKLLSEASGHVVERRTIEETLWGRDAYDDNALHQLVRRTREKIRDDGSAPRLLLTLPGAGYRLDLSAKLQD
jgi:hypothetical protein